HKEPAQDGTHEAAEDHRKGVANPSDLEPIHHPPGEWGRHGDREGIGAHLSRRAITVHGLRVTGVQKRIEPQKSFSGASVDPTDARSEARRCFGRSRARSAKWLRAAEHGSTIVRPTGLRRAGQLPRYARPSSSLTPGFAGPST